MSQVETSSRYKHPPKLLAKMDLFTEEQRRLHDTIRYFHGSQWPVFRPLGMSQASDGTIYEAVHWGRMLESRFSVVCWNLDGRGFSWTDHKSAAAALRALGAVASAKGRANRPRLKRPESASTRRQAQPATTGPESATTKVSPCTKVATELRSE